PTTYVRKFRERSRERFLSPAERRRLEEVLRRGEALSPGSPGNIDWGIAAAIRLLALTGMRRSEVLGLEWSMVDTRLRCIRLPDSKTGQRVVPLGTPVLRLLEKLEQRREPLCPYVIYSRNRTPLHATTIGKSWQRIRDLAGLAKVRLHDLRHSAASDAIMSGVPLAVVGKILGHSQPQTTARYAHISDSALAQAVERMSLSIAACGEPGGSKG
ncbi:MAG: site-specific integrase, partial [Myxococcales bacterium]|nr:site-specific integrase [Myxococcales bacterium]